MEIYLDSRRDYTWDSDKNDNEKLCPKSISFTDGFLSRMEDAGIRTGKGKGVTGKFLEIAATFVLDLFDGDFLELPLIKLIRKDANYADSLNEIAEQLETAAAAYRAEADSRRNR